MARPKKNRNVFAPPSFSNFKPAGHQTAALQQILLTLDEYEALRLADYDGLEHSEAAEMMHISRPTFTRLITKARQKTASFIVEGKALQIEGGAVHFSKNTILCLECANRYPVSMNKNSFVCPECGSDKSEDLARNFGHGKCCRGHMKKTRNPRQSTEEGKL